jgi:hypothetical protein
VSRRLDKAVHSPNYGKSAPSDHEGPGPVPYQTRQVQPGTFAANQESASTANQNFKFFWVNPRSKITTVYFNPNALNAVSGRAHRFGGFWGKSLGSHDLRVLIQ